MQNEVKLSSWHVSERPHLIGIPATSQFCISLGKKRAVHGHRHAADAKCQLLNPSGYFNCPFPAI